MTQPTSKELRYYLLGRLAGENESIRDKIDERALVDDEFLEILNSEEEELIQNYVDGELSAQEVKYFEENYLVSAERIQKVEFARGLRTKIDQLTDASSSLVNPETSPGKSQTGFFAWLMSPIPAVASLIVIIGVSSFLFWNFYIKTSDSEIALASLNKAFSKERPLESKISGFDYAPFNKTRGAAVTAENEHLLLAENLALRSKLNQENAESLHLLGKLYLAKRDFVPALESLKKAKVLAPEKTDIANDLGVCFLELGKIKKAEGDNLALDYFSKAIEQFDSVLAKDPINESALFNKGQTLFELNLPNQTKATWDLYLKNYPKSDWAVEIRSKQTQTPGQSLNLLTPKEMERRVTDELSQGDQISDELWAQISANRELISYRYLPIRLNRSALHLKGSDRQRALVIAAKFGRIEKVKIGDNFTHDLSRYYRESGNFNSDLLKESHDLMDRGFSYSLKNQFGDALDAFNQAKLTFLKAGNVIEAETIAAHFVAYAKYMTQNREEAFVDFEAIDAFARKKEYKWFWLLNRNWYLGAADALRKIPVETIRLEIGNSFQAAEDINDLYLIQKYGELYLRKSHFLGNRSESNRYISKLLSWASDSRSSKRQSFRNLDVATSVLLDQDLDGLAGVVSLESLSYSEPLEDDLFRFYALMKAGIANTKSRNFEIAEDVLARSSAILDSIPGDDSKALEIANLNFRKGDLEFAKEDYVAALANYDLSAKKLDGLNEPLVLFDVEKSRLYALQRLNKRRLLFTEIDKALEFAEAVRTEIKDDESKVSFFEDQQSIFELAIDEHVESGDYRDAFKYAEMSRGRSALDGFAASRQQVPKTYQVGNRTGHLQDLSQIQSQLAKNQKILAFSVLTDRTIAWLVSNSEVESRSIKVSREVLENDLRTYLKALSSQNHSDSQDEKDRSRRLYGQLILPITESININDRVCIVPSGILFKLPFSALFDGEKRLAEKNSYSIASSASFCLATGIPDNSIQSFSNSEILAVGNPRFDRSLFPNLPDLGPGGLEAEEISRFYARKSVLIGPKALKSSVLKYLDSADVIHFAGHYVSDERDFMKSKLVLSKSEMLEENYLTSEEIAKNGSLKARLVVLSACETGVEAFNRSEGALGLTRTFALLGVPDVVASRWKIDSDSTQEIMNAFHANLQVKKLDSGSALKLAKTRLLSSSKYSHPYYWAGFDVFGGFPSG